MAALIAMFAIGAALVVLNPAQLLSPLFPHGGPAALAAALIGFFFSAVSEEAAKAAGVGLQNLKRSRINWFWITLATAGAFGVIERTARVFYTLPEYRPASGLDLAWEGAAIVFHIALSVSVIIVARLLGGRFGWAAGILGAGTLHFLYNILQYEYAMLALSGAVLALAFAYRRRLDWRSAD